MASRDEYEAEQQRLRERHGFEDDEDFDPEAFQVPDVNPEIYKDVEPVLFQGFLTSTATINGVTFVFKSLNHHEFNKLSLIHDINAGPKALQDYYSSFLAHGVLYAGGENVLQDRDSHMADLQDFFNDLNPEAKQVVIRNLSEVNRRANKAIVLTEAYTMENSSRLRWAQLRGLDLTSTAITGFYGTQSLGMNWGQLLWRAINHFEDQRENAEREWENAKFVASSMAGKGMQKVYSADKRRRQSDQKEKVERREKIIRHALLNTPLDGEDSSNPVVVARTVPELAKQLERDLKHEQDWHDRVISEHESRIRKGYEDRMERVRTLREDHIKKFGDKAIVAGPTEVGLSRKEVEQRLQERQRERARAMEARSKHPELFDPKYAEFTNKWVEKPIVQNPPSVMTPPERRDRSTPFKGGSS